MLLPSRHTMNDLSRCVSPSVSDTDSAASYASSLSEEEPVLYTRQLVDRRPKSTWHLKPRAEQSIAEYVFTLFHKESLHEVKPLTLDRGPVPRASVLKENAQFLPMVLVPLAVQEVVYRYFPQFGNWSTGFASLIYGVGFMYALLTTVRFPGCGTIERKLIDISRRSSLEWTDNASNWARSTRRTADEIAAPTSTSIKRRSDLR